MAAIAVATEATISARSRNLGLGWSNDVERVFNQRGESSRRVAAPTAPAVTGGPRAVETELSRAAQINAGNDWSARLFVGGKVVDAVWDNYFEITGEETVYAGSIYERVDPVYTDRGMTWKPCHPGDLLTRIRFGETLCVRLAT